LVLADHEETLSSWLDRHGVVRGWMIAPPLAAAGVDLAWCERAAGVLAGPLLRVVGHFRGWIAAPADVGVDGVSAPSASASAPGASGRG